MRLFLSLEQNHHLVRPEFTTGHTASDGFPTLCTQLVELGIGDIDEFPSDDFVFPFYHGYG